MILKILDTSKTLATLATDTTEGLGRLPEVTRATVTEERNGAFYLEFKVPMTALHFSDIALGGLILAKPNPFDDDQMFRVQKISKPLNGIVSVLANHVSYDLGKTSVAPFTSTGAVAALAAIKTNMTGGSAFSFSTDITNTSSTFTNLIPQSARALFGGQSGSLLDVFGGEFVWDNLTVALKASRGSDRGVTIEYGKNLTDIKQDENIESMYTTVVPFVQDGNGNVVVGATHEIVQTDEPRVLNLDLSSEFEVSNGLPDTEDVDDACEAYVLANDLTSPKVSIDVSFVNLADTEEYKDIARLEEVHLCDTVTIRFPKLGIDASAKVNKYEFNVLSEKYESIELGDAKSTLSRTILDLNNQSKSEIDAQSGFLDSYIAGLTQIITNSLGLFQTVEVQPNGAKKVYLHNAQTLAESQYQWTINSGGFALSTDYGQTWSAGIDSEGNAVLNSLAANTIRALDIYGATISAGVLVFDPDGQPVTARGSTLGTNNGVIFTGEGDFTVECASVGITGTGSSSGTQEIQIVGYDGNGNLKNLIKFTDTSMDIQFSGSSHTLHFVADDTNGLSLYIDGAGYAGLGWVNDGNGHAVLGK